MKQLLLCLLLLPTLARAQRLQGQVRDQAGRKIGCDARRVKLIFQGKNLKDDGRLCRQEGLKHESQILSSPGSWYGSRTSL